jgi:hypothetical protein
MDDLIASLLLYFDNRINGARIFPPMAVLAILAAKQSRHETYSVIHLSGKPARKYRLLAGYVIPSVESIC